MAGAIFTQAVNQNGGQSYTASAPGFTPESRIAPVNAIPGSPQGILNSNYNPKAQAGEAGSLEPTVLATQNIDTRIADNNARMGSIPQAGQTAGGDGFVRNADQSFAEAPSDATAVIGENGQQHWQSGGLSYALGNSGGKISSDPSQQALYDQFTALKAQMDATGAANIANIQRQYESLIAQQHEANKSSEAGTYSLLARGGSLQTDSSSGINQAQISYGLRQIADLNNKEQSAIIAAQAAQQDGDYKIMDKQLAIIQQARTEKQAAASKISDAIIAAQKTVTERAQKLADDKTATDKAIDTQIRSAILDAQKGNATPEQLKAMQEALASHDYAGAIAAGGTSFQDPTSTAGQYAAYVRSATAAHQTPMSPTAYLNRIEYGKSFASAQGAAAGKAAGEATQNTQNTQNAVSSLTPTAQKALKDNGFLSFKSGVQDLAMQLVNGMIAPSELSKRASSGGMSYNDILTAANKYSQATTNKSFDIAKADRNYKFASNPATQNTLNYLGSLVGSDNGTGLAGGNLDQLITMSKQRATGYDSSKWGHGFAPSNLPPLTNVEQWAKINTGDPQMAAYYGTLLEVSDQVAKILQGGGAGGGTSDAKLAQAASLFAKGFTPDQIEAVASSLKELLASRAAGIVRDNPYLSDYATQFGVKQVDGVTTTNQKIIAEEKTAEGKLSAFQNSKPENKSLIDAIHTQFPDMTAQEVAEKLGL